jgi:acyl-CoA thioesterase-2
VKPPDFAPFGVLLECLDIEALDNDLFLGDPGPGEGRLFGGMVAAQSVMAAIRTVPGDRALHSIHAYFLRPGRHDVPLRFVVDRIRDGRTYTTRRVKAHQAGESIFSLEASFAVPEDGISHHDEMPDVPPPEEAEDWEDMRTRMSGAPTVRRESPIEARVLEPIDAVAQGGTDEARQTIWLRVNGELPEDPHIHTAMLVYMTDRGLLGALARRHRTQFGNHMAASLDHAVWIHRTPKLEDWLLYDCMSPVSHGGRGICMGSIYDRRDGSRVASVAQEALLRLTKD